MLERYKERLNKCVTMSKKLLIEKVCSSEHRFLFYLFISAVNLALFIFGRSVFEICDNNLKSISFSPNRRRWHAVIKACRTGSDLVTLPQ